MWESLVKLYDNLVAEGKPVCPIAHTCISVHIAVLLSQAGEFLCAMVPPVRGELTPVPCTIESESRTSGVAPHLISDQLQYVSQLKKFKTKHQAYIKQLGDYVHKNQQDEYARAVFKYVSKGTVYNDIKNIIPKDNPFPIQNLNILFVVYGNQYNGQDPMWTEYYLSTLKPNGICCVTGEKVFIPKTHTRGIMSAGGNEKLFVSGSPVGYVASQKINHALQYIIYEKHNHDRVEAEYKIKEYMSGEITERELKEWTEKEYPGKWNKFIRILNSGREYADINET